MTNIKDNAMNYFKVSTISKLSSKHFTDIAINQKILINENNDWYYGKSFIIIFSNLNYLFIKT